MNFFNFSKFIFEKFKKKWKIMNKKQKTYLP